MIKIYSSEEINKARQSGKILAKVLRELKKKAKAGVVLNDLDNLARQLIQKEKAEPAFLGYQPGGAERPYAYSICASVNNVVVHGAPTGYKLKDGDILKIDLGVKYLSFCSDAAITLGIGHISGKTSLLIKAAQEALEEAVRVAKPERHLGDIGWAVEKTARKFGVKVIKSLTGHGIGHNLHEEPTIYNYGEKNKGFKLEKGMVLAIEPMFSLGSEDVVQMRDESWATADGSLSAHFEHTIALIGQGNKILTSP